MKICIQCSSTFKEKVERQKFCSQACSAIFNNFKRGFAQRPTCITCKHKFTKRDKEQIYCSQKCKTGSKIEQWLTGHWTGSTKNGLSTLIRQFLLKEADYKCEDCSWSKVHPITKLVPLTIEHIDGNPTNHSKENLKVLCPNCHSLTPTYGALNKGNGRKFRYKIRE